MNSTEPEYVLKFKTSKISSRIEAWNQYLIPISEKYQNVKEEEPTKNNKPSLKRIINLSYKNSLMDADILKELKLTLRSRRDKNRTEIFSAANVSDNTSESLFITKKKINHKTENIEDKKITKWPYKSKNETNKTSENLSQITTTEKSCNSDIGLNDEVEKIQTNASQPLLIEVSEDHEPKRCFFARVFSCFIL
ncbi:hypothetical protein CDIK_1396 [Cucumispora dikerogammari]|nr:hypothetical protein CDIK_1396 [Cucumispora dikerogammari]